MDRSFSSRVATLVPMARVALFTAVAVAAGYLLVAVPNVELLTLVVALSGALLGPRSGALVGLFTITIYSGLNAWGIPFLPVWIAQMIAMAVTGFSFGRFREYFKRIEGKSIAISMAILGILVTFIFDLLTNLAFPLSTGVSATAWWPYLLGGIPFAVIHIGSNALIFLFVAPVVYTKVRKRFTF